VAWFIVLWGPLVGVAPVLVVYELASIYGELAGYGHLPISWIWFVLAAYAGGGVQAALCALYFWRKTRLRGSFGYIEAIVVAIVSQGFFLGILMFAGSISPLTTRSILGVLLPLALPAVVSATVCRYLLGRRRIIPVAIHLP
jgi:hypothetical protein